jgi:hypothetical protein
MKLLGQLGDGRIRRQLKVTDLSDKTLFGHLHMIFTSFIQGYCLSSILILKGFFACPTSYPQEAISSSGQYETYILPSFHISSVKRIYIYYLLLCWILAADTRKKTRTIASLYLLKSFGSRLEL